MRAGDLRVGTRYSLYCYVTSVVDGGLAVCSPRPGAGPVPVVRVSFDGATPLVMDREVDVAVLPFEEARSYDDADLIQALVEAGLAPVIEASNVSGSPYPYVYVYLSDRGPEGAYVLLSDRRELEDADGIFVGRYADYEDEGSMEVEETIDAAVALARRLAEGRS